ncbi:sugar kinase [candidate division KSB1 bacterium]|nr:sugar kinase [candidate division KSB1 bacterium]
MSKTIVTFGEIMLRLAPYPYQRFEQANTFKATYGGGEANVAVSLSYLGNQAYFVTRIPDNPIGRSAINRLNSFGVHTEFIVWGGERLGIYFLEHGASIRPSNVIYDRAHSAIAEVELGMFDWPSIFKGREWFHITGITPALSAGAAQVSIEAVQAAKKAGLMVSCDLNYRKKLWSKAQAKETMTQLVEEVDIVIANEADAADVFGIEAEKTNVTSGVIDLKHYRSVAQQLLNYCKAQMVAITLRESISASDNGWSALLYDGADFYTSRKYSIHIVDRVGGGDAFGAGLIHGLIHGWPKKDALDFAVAASALKQTIPGDMNLVREIEVLNIVKGDISGRVQR